jgi:hypothetical protein
MVVSSDGREVGGDGFGLRFSCNTFILKYYKKSKLLFVFRTRIEISFFLFVILIIAPIDPELEEKKT